MPYAPFYLGLNYLGMLLANINGIMVRPPWLHLRLNLHMALVCPCPGVLNIALLWKACQLSLTHMNPTLFSQPDFHIAKMKWGWENMINISHIYHFFLLSKFLIGNCIALHQPLPHHYQPMKPYTRKKNLKVNLQDFIANFVPKIWNLWAMLLSLVI